MHSKARLFLHNFPIPEWYVAFLIGGRAVHAFFPIPLLPKPQLRRLLGWLAVVSGISGIAWALWTARDTDVGKPQRLLTTGPYARSRNPMYVAWTLVGAGVALIVNSVWLLLGLVPAIALTRRFSVLPEERALQASFGEKYAQYRARVRRWL